MRADACRWVHHGGRKVPIPDDLQELADRAGDRLDPNRGNPFHKAMDFRVDDKVRWFKSDAEIPAGTVGTVVGFKPELPKPNQPGPKVLQIGRIYVAWGVGKYYAMDPTELLLYNGTRTVPVGADWRGKIPKKLKGPSDPATYDSAENIADLKGSGVDSSPPGEDEDELHETCWHRPIGACPEHIPGETEVVQVPVDFIIGDIVTWCNGDVPENDIGAVTTFTPQLEAKVIFCSSKKLHSIPQKELKLYLPSAADDVVTVYKTLTVQHLQLIMEQQQADTDFDELIPKLRDMSDKELKAWMKHKYPDRHGEEIDKQSVYDQRDEHEKKKHWKQRVHEMHAEQLASEEKAQKDQSRAAKIAELATLIERARVDYEHAMHLSAKGSEAARIVHAEHMHESHEKWDKDHKRVLQFKTREEKEARRLRDQQDYEKVLAAQKRLKHKEAELARFAESVGIHKDAQPGGVAGLIKEYSTSKIVLVQGFDGDIETPRTIKEKLQRFGNIAQVIEQERAKTHDEMDWALVVFSSVEAAKAALVGAHTVEWANAPTVTTRILGHTEFDAHFIFDAVDTDGSGSISLIEFKAAMRWLGVPDAQAHEMMQLADVNADGKLDWPEFAGFAAADQVDDKAQVDVKTTARKGKTKPASKQSRKTVRPRPEENENPLFVGGEQDGAFEREERPRSPFSPTSSAGVFEISEA